MAGRAGRVAGLLFVVAATLIWAQSAQAGLPGGFFGVVPQGQLSSRDFDRMQGVVGTLRIPVYWFQVEPRPGQYDFTSVDEVVGQAADRGVRVLPSVYGSPTWLTGDAALPPQNTARGRLAWAAFLRRLVDRYGPRGSFWGDRARREPIRRWQIWNEPNFLLFWRPRPSPTGYARLLRIAAAAIRGEDRGGQIVTAGIAPVEAGMLPWRFLLKLYRVPGVGGSFDLVGLHPYSSTLRGLEYEIRQTRRVMARAGAAGTPLLLTELGTASGGAFPNPYNQGPAGQASYLRGAFRLLIDQRRRWRIAGVDWFSWQDAPSADPHCVFCQYAGLFDASGTAKPAWHAFRAFASGAADTRVR
jgi:polysaccharide biosynthesis protein PslG